jgi:hypothetical protein
MASATAPSAERKSVTEMGSETNRPTGPLRAGNRADNGSATLYGIATPQGNWPTGTSAIFLFDRVSITAMAFERPHAT